MEYDSRFLPERPPFSSSPQRFNGASETAKGEGGKREDG
jgi:hypothetical protein